MQPSIGQSIIILRAEREEREKRERRVREESEEKCRVNKLNRCYNSVPKNFILKFFISKS
jgi:hypothetical protein